MGVLVFVALLAVVGGAQAQQADFSDALAKKYLAFAGASYCYGVKGFNVSSWDMSADCVEAAPADFAVTHTFYNKSTDAFGLLGVSHTDKFIVGAIKGTDPGHIVDILEDLKSVFVYDHNCNLRSYSVRTHQGFCAYYTSLKNEGMLDDFFSLHTTYPSYQIVVTGHSLGGAAAHLLGVDLMTSTNLPVTFYTYGEPRTGASDFALKTNSLIEGFGSSASYYRLIHDLDPVPRIPFCSYAKGQDECKQDNLHPYHSDRGVLFNDDMDSHTLCPAGDNKACNKFSLFHTTQHLYYYGKRVGNYCCVSDRLSAMREGETQEDKEFAEAFVSVFGPSSEEAVANALTPSI